MSVELTRHGAYALVRLNRPEALNALSTDVLHALAGAFAEVDAQGRRAEVRALLITGAGDQAFCAGADIKEFLGRGLVGRKRGAELGQRTFAMLDTLSVPSVALVNGYAFGGGLELALACTFRLAAPSAKVGLPEIRLGVIPGYGGTQRLPRLIGEGRALEMIMTGRTVGADEAERIGLVHRVVEGDLLAAGTAFADGFSAYSLPVLGFAREAVMRAHDTPVSEGLKIEADLNTLAFSTEDAAEGAAAFLAKRKPEFKDA